ACEAVMDDLAAIVDGDVAITQKHADHLATCDACRDARHEATRLRARVAEAGADWVAPPPAALEGRVANALDARAGSPAEARPAAPGQATAVERKHPPKQEA